MPATRPLFTIGHSNRPLETFVELLRESGIDLVVDVRKLAGSSRYPQYNADALGRALVDAGIELSRADGLAGRRPVSKDIPFEVNAWWTNRSFHNYADHGLGAEFRDSLAELRRWAAERTVAVMCSEAVWWRCHRRIISDHLLARGDEVRHILGSNQVAPARLSDGAVRDDELGVSYPAAGPGVDPAGAAPAVRDEMSANGLGASP